MKILITGGTGGMGKMLIPKLINDGHQISVLCRNKNKAEAMLPRGCRIIIGDVTDADSIKGCCDGIDVVYHLVGISGNERPSEYQFARYRKVNVQGTKNMVDEAQERGVRRFIYVSSIAAMGLVKKMPINSESECNPKLPYHVSKYEAEQVILNAVKDKGFPAIILRPSQVYGVGGEYTYQNIIRMVKRGLFPKIGLHDHMVSHCYMDDLITTLTLALNKGAVGNIYICTTEKSIGFYESVKLIAKYMNRRLFMIPIPRWGMMIVAFFVEKLYALKGKTPPVTRSNIKAVTADRIYDLSKNMRDLGFISSVTMEEGIKRCVEYNKQQGVF